MIGACLQHNCRTLVVVMVDFYPEEKKVAGTLKHSTKDELRIETMDELVDVTLAEITYRDETIDDFYAQD